MTTDNESESSQALNELDLTVGTLQDQYTELDMHHFQLKNAARLAYLQMVRMGNELNWEPPMDQEFVDALNGIRALVAAE